MQPATRISGPLERNRKEGRYPIQEGETIAKTKRKGGKKSGNYSEGRKRGHQWMRGRCLIFLFAVNPVCLWSTEEQGKQYVRHIYKHTPTPAIYIQQQLSTRGGTKLKQKIFEADKGYVWTGYAVSGSHHSTDCSLATTIGGCVVCKQYLQSYHHVVIWA